MRRKGSSQIKFTVIIGYVLVMGVMAFGLITLYNNLVDYSNKKINNQDLSELLVVSNTLSLLYEIESEQNLLTSESAEQYFRKYDSIVPIIKANLVELKEIAADTARVVKIDSIELLVEMKKENLLEMAVLLDSLRRSPRILRQSQSSYVPKELNREISDYLESRNLAMSDENRSDTSVVVGERKGFFNRMRDAITGRPDSTIVIENKSVMGDSEFKLIVDTIINKVRYSEKLDLERQRRFQEAFLARQEMISLTNRMLTGWIDDLLKEIEQGTMRLATLVAVMIALVFGVLFLVDINKSQRYRRQLETSNRRISELLASRERLMLTISHDIKAPMSSILGYLELMDGQLVERMDRGFTERVGDDALTEEEKRKIREYLANMQRSGQHVLQLVSTLLDYHKLESGAWQMKRLNVNLKALVEETMLSFKPMATRKGLDYRVENELPAGLVCYADAYVLRQVMGNLISNAVKYTSRGSVDIVAREEVKEGVPHLVFRVADTGPGIDPDSQKVAWGWLSPKSSWRR